MAHMQRLGFRNSGRGRARGDMATLCGESTNGSRASAKRPHQFEDRRSWCCQSPVDQQHIVVDSKAIISIY